MPSLLVLLMVSLLVQLFDFVAMLTFLILCLSNKFKMYFVLVYSLCAVNNHTYPKRSDSVTGFDAHSSQLE